MENPQPCQFLRTKTLYIPEQAAEAFYVNGEPKDGSPCWCNRTLRPLGPDDGIVGVKACSDRGRVCHQTR